MRNAVLILMTLLIVTSCNIGKSNKKAIDSLAVDSLDTSNEERPQYDSASFAYFLQHFPRKKDKAVRTWDGQFLHYSKFGVLDIDVPQYQQCADAIIRLHAEWLYSRKRYDDISYHFTNGFKCSFRKWAEGYRVRVNGNNASWYRKYNTTDYSYKNFKDYLNEVFYYAGTISLDEYDLVQAPACGHLQVGDVVIWPGSPGHAVIVIDIIIHNKKPYYLFAQSFIPAQNIEIISGTGNRTYKGYSPCSNNIAEYDVECTSQFKRFKIH